MARTTRTRRSSGKKGVAAEPPNQAGARLPDDGFGDNVETRIAQAAELGDLQLDSLATGLRDIMMEMFKQRPKPWSQMPADAQQDLAGHLEYAAKRMVRRAVTMLAQGDRPGVLCKLEGYGESNGVKINLSLSAMPIEEGGEAILVLHRNVRKMVMIVPADVEAFMGENAAAVEADQTALRFESEADPIPGKEEPARDGADLNPGGDQSPAIVDQVSAAAEAENNSENNSGAEISAGAEPAAVNLEEVDHVVYDPDEGDYLLPDKEYWTKKPEEAGRFSKARAESLAKKFGEGAIAQPA